jgi:HEPN domain-containing protein
LTEELKKYIRQWIEKAEEDRLVVKQLIDADSSAKGVMGFHCQQSAEKYLKAFLIFCGGQPPRTHNIEYLLNQCSQIDNDFNEIDPLNLTDYGVEARYPGDFLQPSDKELIFLLGVVDQIREMVLEKIKI